MSEEIYSLSYYGSRADEHETATEFEWDKDDPRRETFCDSPYETVLYYKILENGEKKFIEVKIDGKSFLPGEKK